MIKIDDIIEVKADFILGTGNDVAKCFAVLIGNKLNLPVITDRGYIKEHGGRRRFEGIKDLNKLIGKRCLVVMAKDIKKLQDLEINSETPHNNDLKKVCPKCGKILTYKMNDSGMYGCLNILCNWQGKPIIKL